MKRLVLVSFVLSILLVYGAFMAPWFVGAKKVPYRMDFFNRQTNAFLNGQLSLLSEPPLMLLRLADPYDPDQNAPIIRNENNGLWDLSLYNEKLYMYFGVGPVVSLFLPYRLVTGGAQLPPWAAVFVFSVVTLVAGFAVLRELGCMVFGGGEVPLLWTVGGALLLGLGSGIQFLFLIAAHYEIAVAGGICFVMLGLWLSLWSVRESNHGLMFAAGLSFGLAIACRPHLILLVPLVAIFVLRSSPRPWFLLRWMGAPIGLFCVLIMVYNYARFESPLEFGTKYQLGIYNAPQVKLFHADYVPRSSFLIFLQKPRFYWRTHTPVRLRLKVPRHVDKVENHFQEGMAGVLWLMPLVLPALALVTVPWLRRFIGRGRSPHYLAALDTLWLGAGAILGFLCFFSATIPRYLIDALPLLSLAVWGTTAPLFGIKRVGALVSALCLLASIYSALAWTSITYAKEHGL